MSLSRVGRSGITVATSPKNTRSLTDASGLPGPVTNIVATATGNTTATLSWTAPVISGDGSITTYDVTEIGGASVTVSVSETTASLSGLVANTTYTFIVSAVNILGNGKRGPANSAIITFNFNDATGGTIATVTNYLSTGQTWRTHTFTSNGTLSVNNAGSQWRYLLVGGGAGGGGCEGNNAQGIVGGAGGAGGMVENLNATIASTGDKTVTIGAGGGGSCGGPGGNGGSTTFNSQTASGGGRGGAHWACGGGAGGSGGGGRSWNEGNCGGGGGTSFQGHAGRGGCGNGCCASGGGASTFESSTSHKTGGRSSSVSGTSSTYAPGSGRGNGGGCGNWNTGGGSGTAGIAVIAYRIE